MKNLFFVAILVISFIFPLVGSAQSVVPATGAELDNLCLEQCGPTTWQIAVPVGTAPELSLDGDTLRVSVLVTPTEQGPILRWTAELPAHPDGSLAPDPGWLHDQPFMVVLEWTTEPTGTVFVPATNSTRTQISGGVDSLLEESPARVDCDCAYYDESQRGDISEESLIWEFKHTRTLALLQRNPEQCGDYLLTGRHVFGSHRQVGWVLRDGHWYTLDEAREFLASPYDWRNEYMTIRYSDCPPQDVAEASGE